jgi:Immunity protein 8
MIAELKSLHSPDVADLHDWTPDSKKFAILLQIMAGPEGAPGEESFDVTLCSSTWVSARAEEVKLLEGRYLLIVPEYDSDLIYDCLSRRVSSCEGESWQEVARKLSQLGRWEFEDYHD